MRIATYNCNGIRTRIGAILSWLTVWQPDILALQETKVEDEKFPAREFKTLGWYTAYTGQKRYNGVALLSRYPIDIRYTRLPGYNESECRFIHADIGGLEVLNSYVPHGRELGHDQYASKLEYFEQIREHELFTVGLTNTPVAWVGDMNVAYRPEDVYEEARVQGPCYGPEIQQAFAKTAADGGLYDVFRKFRPGPDHYTCWDFRVPNAVDRHKGWRIDYILANDVLASKCTNCWADIDERRRSKPSDHTYVVADFDMNLNAHCENIRSAGEV